MLVYACFLNQMMLNNWSIGVNKLLTDWVSELIINKLI